MNTSIKLLLMPENKTFLLGIFGENVPLEIPDPVGSELAQYMKSFSYIVRCIDNLMVALTRKLQHGSSFCDNRR